MGTYIYARLINKSEENIKNANESIEKFGYPTEAFNGIKYGFLYPKKCLKKMQGL
jgi:hypothetical protein